MADSSGSKRYYKQLVAMYGNTAPGAQRKQYRQARPVFSAVTASRKPAIHGRFASVFWVLIRPCR